MHPCRFPSGASRLKKKNDFDVKYKNSSFNFSLDDVKFKSGTDTDKSDYRITLIHKETGEIIRYNSKWLTFKPDLQKLNNVDTGNIVSVSKIELLREFGSAKDQRMLKESEKHQVNADAQKAVRAAQFAAVKAEKIEAIKGMQTDMSYLDVDGTTDGDNRQVKLSIISPSHVLESLSDIAINFAEKTSTELGEMVLQNSLHLSIFELIKNLPKSDIRRMRICALLNHMISFYMLPIKSIRNQTFEGCPHSVLQFLIKCYTVEVSSDMKKAEIQMPKPQKDKLFDMILSLYCYLSDYNFSLNQLQVDLKSSTDRLKKHLQQFHVKVTRSTKNIGEESTLKEFMASTKVPFVID